MKKTLISGSVAGALALLLATGGYFAQASAETRVAPAVAGPGAPVSFADIIQRVSPAVVSVDVEGKSDPSHIAFGGGGGDDDSSPFGGDGDSQGGSPFGFVIPRGQQQPRKMEATGSGFFV